ncbi:sensor histidine kinase [Chitinophaga sp. Hz27]|uniref:sensor histidine kinase n=1 Tax=Chitinophaga sp. Hz27 TaxID=3347169 RepID=UPI0035E20DBE
MQQDCLPLVASETQTVAPAVTTDQLLFMMASWSHDLLSNFNSIITLNELVQRDDPASVLEFVDNIQFRIQTLQRLSKTIYQFSQVESEKIEMEDIPVRTYIKKRLHSYEILAQRTGRHFESELMIPDSVHICTDSARLDLVLENLITNAVKYSPEASTIIANVRTIDDQLAITLTNSCVNMPEEYLDMIFKPYVRLDNSIPGYGIGLATCRRLCSQINGRIEATTHQNTISFTVQLPSQA